MTCIAATASIFSMYGLLSNFDGSPINLNFLIFKWLIVCIEDNELVYSRKSNKNTVCGRFSIYEHYYGSNGHKSGLPAVDIGVAVEGKAEGCGGTGKGKCMGWTC